VIRYALLLYNCLSKDIGPYHQRLSARADTCSVPPLRQNFRLLSEIPRPRLAITNGVKRSRMMKRDFKRTPVNRQLKYPSLSF
jgi:hypothetical protein